MQIPVRLIILLFVCIALLLSNFSCAPKITVPAVSEQEIEDEFSKAEFLFEKGAYENALEKYRKFLEKYPHSSLASAALMKVATIYRQREDYENARLSYEKLVSEYPGSMVINDARLELLAILLKQENYPELLIRSEKIPKRDLSRIQKIRMEMMVGEAYLATGALVDATKTFITAYGTATPLEQNTIIEKIKDAFVELTEDDINKLLEKLEQPEDMRMVAALKDLMSFDKNVIGCLLPMTGPYHSIGKRAAKGMELAFNEWTGRNQQELRLVIKDTGSDHDTTILGAQELMDEKVACILGPIITADLAADIAQKRRVPIITLTQKEDITEKGEYIFRNFITPGMQVKALLSYAMDQKGAKRFAILYPKEKYGTTFMNHFWDEVIKKKGEVVGAEAYDLEETDFSAPVKKLVGLYYPIPEDIKITVVEQFNVNKTIEKNIEYIFNTRFSLDPVYLHWTDHLVTAFSGLSEKEKNEEDELNPIVDFDAVFIPDSPEKIAMIVPQLPYYDISRVMLLGPNIWHSQELIEHARYYVQGAVLTEGFFAESRSLKVQAFIERFERTYNEKPGFIEAIAYDTALLIFQNFADKDFQLRSDIQKELINLNPFEGVTGLTTFNETGEAVKKMFLLEVQGREFVELEQ